MERSISRRTLLATTGAAAGAAILGSAMPKRSFARQGSPVTLKWWDYYTAANGAAMDAQIKAYMDSHPNVKIERTSIPFADLKQKLLQGATAGDLPDLAVIDNPDHQAFASLGVLADITEQVNSWGQANSYFKGPWDSTTFQGKNYGIPDNSNCLTLWYNVDLFGPVGAEPPTDWASLTAVAQALTKGDQYGLAVSAVKSEEGTFQWLPFLWATGADIPTIDSDGGRRALQIWTDYVQNGYMSKSILGWKQADVLAQFQNGKAAMMVNGPWQIPVLKEQSPNLKWNVVTLPKEQQAASILGGENTAITKSTKNMDAAWEFLTWRQEPQNLKAYLVQAGKLPSRQDLAGDETWTGDPVLKVFIEQLQVAKPRAYGDKYPQISAAIQDAIQSAVSGQTDVAAALKKAQLTITPLLPKTS